MLWGIALGGMEAAQQSLETAGRRLAKAADPGTAADAIDLSAELVTLLSAKHQFTANAQVVKVADEMQKQAVDLFA